MSRLILGCRSAAASPALLDVARSGRLAGLLWFREALGGTVAEAAARVSRLRDAWPAGTTCLFAVDEEGGLIQQLSGLEESPGSRWPRLPSPRALGRGGDPEVAYAHGREIGRRMRALGLDVALAPLVDLDPGPGSAVLGTRCFGEDPDLVVRLALAWLRGLASAGRRGCLKHYPGHGATPADSHRALPRISTRADRPRHRQPFIEIARRWDAQDGPPPAVLTAHLLLESSEVPATFDRAVLDEVPDRLGPIWTDSLEMGALERFGDLAARARLALEAGADLLIVGEDVAGGLDLARRLSVPRSRRVAGWSPSPSGMPPAPAPWGLEAIVEAATAGLRLLRERPLPLGGWDWILPERFGTYGPVAEPDLSREGRRWIARVLRYPIDRLATLGRLLAERPARPALVGWIHRGRPDEETLRLLDASGGRVHAIAHLLDGPPEPLAGDLWSAETCGFGEGELAALQRLWSRATDGGFAD